MTHTARSLSLNSLAAFVRRFPVAFTVLVALAAVGVASSAAVYAFIAPDYSYAPFAPVEAADVVYPDFPYPIPETPSHCSKPTPATPAAYAAMFAGLDTRQWGAADVSLSVPLGDGRELWLYGDTFQAGHSTLTHSTAIVQDGGCLHLANGGRQLLPNDSPTSIYWITSATLGAGFTGIAQLDQQIGTAVIDVKARREILTGDCPWCFKDGGVTRQGLLEVNYRTDDVHFDGWNSTWDLVEARSPSPAPKPISPMIVLGPHHFTYEHRVHHDIALPDGGYLVTDCQNWDDGVLHGFADYRPIFSEGIR